MAQFVCLHQFPDAFRFFSGFHSGCGQRYSVLGITNRRRHDFLVVERPGFFRYIQYHSGLHSRYHRDDCKFASANPFQLDQDTKNHDAFAKQYARVLTEGYDREIRRERQPLAPQLKVFTEVRYECTLHNPVVVGGGGGGENGENETFQDPFDLLKKKYPQESILGLKWSRISETRLLEKLLDETKLAGFVTIEGGCESVKDAASHFHSFIIQKDAPDPSTLGAHARHLASEREGGEADPSEKERLGRENLEKRCRGRELTCVKKSLKLARTLSL